MLKKLSLIAFTIGIVYVQAYGQGSDAYELQRNKINSLLAERSAKFGQYDQSLQEKTGIFGFQTKQDIRNSNEILRQIALNDNNIFTELKVLLDYKDIQFQQVKTDVDNNQLRIDSYKKTIRDLQVKNEELLTFNKKAEQNTGYAKLISVFFGIVSAVLTYILWRKNKLIKAMSPSSKIEIL